MTQRHDEWRAARTQGNKESAADLEVEVRWLAHGAVCVDVVVSFALGMSELPVYRRTIGSVGQVAVEVPDLVDAIVRAIRRA